MRLQLVRYLRTAEYDRIDLLVSFIMKSGLRIIDGRLEDAIARGARVRVLTTDYLRVTDADALARLLDLSEATAELEGSLEVRIFSDPLTSFHPKAYLFWSSAGDVAQGFVGSNNLSFSGIESGVEWSLAADSAGTLVRGFDDLWNDRRSRPLDHATTRRCGRTGRSGPPRRVSRWPSASRPSRPPHRRSRPTSRLKHSPRCGLPAPPVTALGS